MTINNFKKQIDYKTYSGGNEIKEAISHLQKYINVSTYKFLNYFIRTKTGVTQAKIDVICEKIGISTTSYYNVVKRELDTLFEKPLIERKKAPLKLSKNKTKKVRGSEYKILISLDEIKKLTEQKEKELEEKYRGFYNQDDDDDFDDSGDQTGDQTGDDSHAETPSDSKAEDEKSAPQLKSFRKDLLEKDLNNLIKDDQIFKVSSKKIGIKKEIKNYMNTFPLFRDFSNWSQAKIYEVSRTLQLAIVKHGADLQDVKIQYMIKDAIKAFSQKHLKKPQDDFLRLFYTYISNALKNTQADDPEDKQDDSEDYFSPLFKRIIEKKARDWEAQRQERESRQDLDDLGVF